MSRVLQPAADADMQCPSSPTNILLSSCRGVLTRDPVLQVVLDKRAWIYLDCFDVVCSTVHALNVTDGFVAVGC